MKIKKVLGWHHLIDYHDCDFEILDSPRKLRLALETAARRGRATVVRSLFHRFSPFGVSGVIVIAESHISIHTWPEYGSATVDIFSCTKKMNIPLIKKIIAQSLKPRQTVHRCITRGRMK